MTLRQWPVKFTIREAMKGVSLFTVTESKVPKKYGGFLLAVTSVRPLEMEPFRSRMKYSGKYSVPRLDAYYDYGLWVPQHGTRTITEIVESINNHSLSVSCILLPETGDIMTLVVQN